MVFQFLHLNSQEKYFLLASMKTLITNSGDFTGSRISNTVRNTLQNHLRRTEQFTDHRRLPECRNKHFEEVYWKDFNN
jgi:hypothetical protein